MLRSTLLFLLAAITLMIHPAAGDQFLLTWSACPGAGPTVPDASFECADQESEAVLYATFQVDKDVVGLFSVDFEITYEFLETAPEFWAPECNPDLLSIDPDPPQCGGYDRPFPSPAQVATWIFSAPAGRYGRILGSVFTDTAKPVSLQAGRPYVAFAVKFNTAAATEAGGSCNGCSTPVALGLPRHLGELPEVTKLGLSALASSRGQEASTREIPFDGCIPANGGSAICSVTPTLPTTWGALKVIYR